MVYNRRREAHIKYPGPDDDVRENIINYDDEGGGEDDMTAFDITPLQIPIGAPLPDHAPAKIPCKSTIAFLCLNKVKAHFCVDSKRYIVILGTYLNIVNVKAILY